MNTNDNVANQAERTVRDAQKRRDEETQVTSTDFNDVDWAPEGGD